MRMAILPEWAFDDGPKGNYSGAADNLPSALNGAWQLNRATERMIDVYDCREGERVKIAEVGVTWVEG